MPTRLEVELRAGHEREERPNGADEEGEDARPKQDDAQRRARCDVSGSRSDRSSEVPLNRSLVRLTAKVSVVAADLDDHVRRPRELGELLVYKRHPWI